MCESGHLISPLIARPWRSQPHRSVSCPDWQRCETLENTLKQKETLSQINYIISLSTRRRGILTHISWYPRLEYICMYMFEIAWCSALNKGFLLPYISDLSGDNNYDYHECNYFREISSGALYILYIPLMMIDVPLVGNSWSNKHCWILLFFSILLRHIMPSGLIMGYIYICSIYTKQTACSRNPNRYGFFELLYTSHKQCYSCIIWTLIGYTGSCMFVLFVGFSFCRCFF